MSTTNANDTALRTKISKMGKAQMQKKLDAGSFTGQELPIALEIAAKRGLTLPGAAKGATPKADKKNATPKTPKAKKEVSPLVAKAMKEHQDKTQDEEGAVKRGYGKSDFVRDQIKEGDRSHKSVAAKVLEKYGTVLYYSEFERCRKQVDQRPSDKK